MQNRLVYRLVVICLVAWLLAAGCSKQAAIDLHPAAGTVTVNGRAAAGVYLQFYGVGPTARPSPDGAKTEADGTYHVPLHSPGEYRVTAFWPKVTIHEGENNLSAINLTLR